LKAVKPQEFLSLIPYPLLSHLILAALSNVYGSVGYTLKQKVEVNKRCFHICFHTAAGRLQPIDLYEFLFLEAAHNPLVPGSSPGGPTT
jgi:hypothetical protein